VDGVFEIRCSEPGCDASVELPIHLAEEPDEWTRAWLTERAWRAEERDRPLCPKH
jgi:hypothetical protein